jgi:hypothetical protein
MALHISLVVVEFLLCCAASSTLLLPTLALPGGGGTSSSRVNLDNWGIPYNGVLPQGQVTFSYSADGSFRSLSVQVSRINVPDGTVVDVEAQEIWPCGGSTKQNNVCYSMTIRQGKGTLTLSTTSAANVNFLSPSMGQTDIHIEGGRFLVPMMGAQFGHLGS